MSAHRRPTLIPRSARPRRIPAHQVRAASARGNGHAVTPDTVADTIDVATPDDAHTSDTVADSSALKHGPTTSDDAATTATAIDSDARRPTGPDVTDVYDAVDGTVDSTPQATAPLEITDAPDNEADDDDYAAYVRSVEEAAARSRSQQRRRRAATGAAASSAANTAASAGISAESVAGQAVATAATVSSVGTGTAVLPQPRHPAHPRHRHPGGPGGPRGPRGPRNRALAQREPDPRPRWKRPKTWFVSFASLVLLATASVGAYGIYVGWIAIDAYDKINQPLATQPTVWQINPEGTPVPVPSEVVEQQLPNWDNKDPFNILLLGIDERPDDDEPPRSDTMIVVRVFPETKQVTMMSIPRDLWVTIPEHGEDKINAAYPIAEAENAGSGPGLVMETISYNFDIQIHYYMTIDFDGFREVINTLGGIVIDVRAPIKDDLYPTEEFGVTRAYFPTGLQKMDGETALRFARTRHGDNDIARGDRQQQVLMAIREQASTSDLIRNAGSLIGDFKETVRTDLDANQLLALGNLGRGIDPAEIVRLNLWDAGVLFEHAPEFEGDAFYMGADWPMIYELMSTYFKSPTSGPPLPTATPGAATVSGSNDAAGPDLNIPLIVQNASGYQGIMSSAVSVLEAAGFSSVSREATSEYSEFTVIYDYAESPATAQYIAAQLGLDESSIVYGSDGTGIIVAIGDDVAAGLSP